MWTIASKLSVVLTVALWIAGCDKKNPEENPLAPEPEKDSVVVAPVPTPVIPTFHISIPAPSFSDSCSVGAYVYALTVQSFIAQVSVYGNIPRVTADSITTWALYSDGVSCIFTATHQSSGDFRWKLVLRGTDTAAGKVYDDWTAVEGTTSSDSKSGHLTSYSDDPLPSTSAALLVDWSTVGPSINVEMQLPSEGVKIVLSSNGTSGEVTLLGGPSFAVLLFHAMWATPGGAATCG